MARNTLTRWIGSTRIVEQPGSPKVINSGSGNRTIRTYRGPFSALDSAQPGVGQTVDGSIGKVETVEIQPDGAGTDGPGTMIVTLADDQVTFEVDGATLEKPLERHPLYNAGGDKALTDADLDKIATWKNASNAAERATAYAALSDNAKHFVSKLRRGQESYLVPAPVARKTTRSYVKPTTATIGKRGAPGGFPDIPEGYEWLKTNDKGIKQGARASWERVEEWTAADTWDHDIYPTA
jgi:hypothetical protein